MKVITSSLFQVICFPFEGSIFTVVQKYFDNFGTKESSGATIPVIDNSQPTTKNVGVGMYSLFMGNFNISTPILTIGSNLGSESLSLSFIPFFIWKILGISLLRELWMKILDLPRWTCRYLQ